MIMVRFTAAAALAFAGVGALISLASKVGPCALACYLSASVGACLGLLCFALLASADRG